MEKFTIEELSDMIRFCKKMESIPDEEFEKYDDYSVYDVARGFFLYNHSLERSKEMESTVIYNWQFKVPTITYIDNNAKTSGK